MYTLSKSRVARQVNLLTMLVILALVIAACAGGAPAATEADAETGSEEAVSTAGTELQLMGWASSEAENDLLQQVVDNFNAANAEINVTLSLVPDYDTKLQTALAGGEPPDVFYVDSFRLPDLVAAGALEPAEGNLTDPDDFYPALKDAFTIDGTFYCPPKDFSTLALQYNSDLFDAAGLDYPTSEWTWDELRSAAEQLTDADAGVVGVALNPDFARWIAFLYQAGGTVTDAELSTMTINSAEGMEAFSFLTELIDGGYAAQAADLDSGWPGEALGKGKAAITFEGNWIVPFLADQFPDLNYGVVELPTGAAGQATMAFTVCYGVPANGENTEAAFTLVDYLTGPEGMKDWTDLGLAMPTRQSLRAGWLEQFGDLEPFLNGADYAQKWQFRPGFNDVLDTINNGLQQLYTGSVLVEDVLQDAEEVGNEVLSR